MVASERVSELFLKLLPHEAAHEGGLQTSGICSQIDWVVAISLLHILHGISNQQDATFSMACAGDHPGCSAADLDQPPHGLLRHCQQRHRDAHTEEVH